MIFNGFLLLKGFNKKYTLFTVYTEISLYKNQFISTLRSRNL